MNLRFLVFFLTFLIFTGVSFSSYAQQKDTAIKAKKDTLIKKKDTAKKTAPVLNTTPDTSLRKNNTDTFVKRNEIKKDTAIAKPSNTQTNVKPIGVVPPDTAMPLDSSLKNISRDSLELKFPLINTNKITDRILSGNKMINTSDPGIYYIQEPRNNSGKEFLFYLLCVVVFILGLFKTFFSMYFNNLFRIFFNTSLRQSQLTDQLSQAKLPSFILNIFFFISMGLYLWLLFLHFNWVQSVHPQMLLLLCIGCVLFIYFVKFILLKFVGWLAGIGPAVDNYIFIIFLVNKIVGILLIPFILLLAFSYPAWVNFIAVISGLFLGLLFLSRYVKSYGALDKKFPLRSFHLFIFVVGAEIIPLFIFYKIAVDYLV